MSELRKRSAWLVLVGAFLILPVAGVRAGCHAQRHRHRLDGRRAARRDHHRNERRIGQYLRCDHRRQRRIPPAGCASESIGSRPSCTGFTHRHSHRPADAGRPARNDDAPDVALIGAGDRHRHGRSAAHQHDHVNGGGQHRSAADAGAAAQRPQLARPDAARAGQPCQHGRRDADPALAVAFQINMDGQQVTNSVAGAGFGQPRFSRDSIAEFEFVTNRFDATQGRSMGVVVNAVTKSGTNTPSGTLSGYFRDSDWAAKDPVENRVIPFSNQQYSATYGGPLRARPHSLFANYEYEREPQTAVYNGPYPAFNVDLQGTRTQSTARCEGGLPVHAADAVVESRERVHAVRAAARRRRRDDASVRRVAVVAHLDSVLEPVHAGAFAITRSTRSRPAIYMYDWDITSLAFIQRRSAAQLSRAAPTQSSAITRRRTARCWAAARAQRLADPRAFSCPATTSGRRRTCHSHRAAHMADS